MRDLASEPTKKHMPMVRVKSWTYGLSRRERRHPHEGLRRLNGMPMIVNPKRGKTEVADDKV